MRTAAALAVLALATFVLATLGCSSPSSDSCTSSATCARGLRCVDGRCQAQADGALSDSGSVIPDAARADLGSMPRDAAASRDSELDPDAACVAIEGAARVVKRPVDIVLIVDVSASTGGAPMRVRDEVNAQLARILDGAGIDYRVILLAQGLVIGPPLSTSGRLFTASIGTGSGDDAAFKPVLDGYAMWSGFLRPGVEKVFMHFTDSVGDGRRITGYAGTFDEELYRLDAANFGTAAQSLITYHAVVGLRQRAANPTMPYTAAEPVVTNACSGPEFVGTPGAGPGFQEIAIRTGGVRFPICLFPNFDVLFQLIADSVIDVATVECSFELPTPPAGTDLNLDTVLLRYVSGTTRTGFRRAASSAQCNDASFVIEGGRIALCPAACTRVQADPAAQLSIAFGCASIPL